jgi:hypothetical protein
MKMTELSNYYLYIDSDGKEHRSMVKPRDTRCLRVEILHTDESEIVERTYTFDDRDGKSVQPRLVDLARIAGPSTITDQRIQAVRLGSG